MNIRFKHFKSNGFTCIFIHKWYDMNLSAPVSQIMTSNLITITCNHSLKEAEFLMRKNKIRHIPIVEGKELKGILSLTDLQRISFTDSYDSEEEQVDYVIYDMLTLEEVMVKNPVTCSVNASLKQAGLVLLENNFHALPIVDGKSLVGIVTTTDLLRHLLS
jgi:CBS domain-containing membrane protein